MRRSRQLNLESYDTDKVPNGYFTYYDPVLAPWVGKQIALLEVGVHRAGSLLLWRDYFTSGKIVGIDCAIPRDSELGARIRLFEGLQQDTGFLTRVADEAAPEGFDIIIDDASRIAELTKITFWHLYRNHLKPGGLYVIEDWGTGYWRGWPDGRAYKRPSRVLQRIREVIFSRMNLARRIPVKLPYATHNFGTVGFVKELIDEQGAADLTRESYEGRPRRRSEFDSLTVTPSIVFVRKPQP